MKANILLALLILFSLAQNFAQGNLPEHSVPIKKKSIKLSLGYHFALSQDLVFSPMIYEGSSINFWGLEYDKVKNGRLFQVSAFYDKLKVNPEEIISSPVLGGHRAASEALQVQLQFLGASTIHKTDKARIYLGGQLTAKYYEVSYSFGFDNDEAYFFENAIRAWSQFEYQLNEKTKLKSSVAIPLLSFIARPEYAVVDNRTIQGENGIGYLYRKGELASWGNYQSIDLSFGISTDLSEQIQSFFRYRLNYWRYKKPEALSVLKNHFDLGLSFNF